MGISDIWDWFVEQGNSFISFEWVGDIMEEIIGLFENISELSTMGLVMGSFATFFVYFTSEWTLTPFLIHMDVFNKILWMILTYAGSFIVGYLIGKKMLED